MTIDGITNSIWITSNFLYQIQKVVLRKKAKNFYIL